MNANKSKSEWAAAQLRHPTIVTVHEVGREDDTIHIASEFVQGANLIEWLTSRQLTPREAAELCVEIAEVLYRVYEAGVVYRGAVLSGSALACSAI